MLKPLAVDWQWPKGEGTTAHNRLVTKLLLFDGVPPSSSFSLLNIYHCCSVQSILFQTLKAKKAQSILIPCSTRLVECRLILAAWRKSDKYSPFWRKSFPNSKHNLGEGKKLPKVWFERKCHACNRKMKKLPPLRLTHLSNLCKGTNLSLTLFQLPLPGWEISQLFDLS